MKTKNVFTGTLVLMSAVLFTACKKTPPIEKLSSDFVVMTNYDAAAKFNDYVTYSLRDTIAIATENKKDSVWYDANAKALLQAVRQHLNGAGYVEIGKSAATDIGVQVSAARNVSVFGVTPGYWWGYDGFVTPCYWGNGCYPYYYPYWYSYSIKTGSIMVELVDLKNASAKKKLNVLWTGIGSGQIGDSKSFILEECQKSIDQAFKQSPYIKAYN